MLIGDKRTLAAAIIGTRHLPAGLAEVQEQARRAWAYHRLTPYPTHAFGDWRTEDRGPLPKCLPIARSIVGRGADWLFGEPFEVTCPANTAWEEFVKASIRENRLGTRLEAVALRGAIEGGVALKFAYDPASIARRLTVQTLSLIDHVRLYYHPHDRESLLLARVQYRYQDAADGRHYWYREEWTDEEFVRYLPLPDGDLPRGATPDTFDGWQEDAREPNAFGVIPVMQVRNIDTDDAWGSGDLWDLWPVLDRIHLTWHLMDRSNQFDSDRVPFVIDGALSEGRTVQPGEPAVIESEHAEEGRQAKVLWAPDGNGLRPAMMEYARELSRMVHSAASSIDVRPEDITNKGNLTQAVLMQVHGPQVRQVNKKRRIWADDGLVAFFSLVGRGLSNAGLAGGLGITDDEESHRIEVGWPDVFPLTEEEKVARLGRLQEEETAGYVSLSRIIEEVSEMEDRDLAAVVDELATEPRPSPTERREPPVGGEGEDVSEDAAANARD